MEMGLTFLLQQRSLHPPRGWTNQENTSRTGSPPGWCSNITITVHISTMLIKGITYAQKESRSKTFAEDTSICIKRDPRYLFWNTLQGFVASNATWRKLLWSQSVVTTTLCPELDLSCENKLTLMGFQIDNRIRELNKTTKMLQDGSRNKQEMGKV